MNIYTSAAAPKCDAVPCVTVHLPSAAAPVDGGGDNYHAL